MAAELSMALERLPREEQETVYQFFCLQRIAAKSNEALHQVYVDLCFQLRKECRFQGDTVQVLETAADIFVIHQYICYCTA